MVPALLHLGAFRDGPVVRARKGFDWDALDRLHEQDYTCDSKAWSVVLSDEGTQLGPAAFERHFGT